jgi:hypothetical protein
MASKTGTTWIPTSIEERVDRLESLEQIRDLAHRYALAVDTRDLDALVALFLEDIRVGREESGREALKAWYARSLERFGTTIHFVGNQVVDLDSPDSAHGITTCRDELEIGAEWMVGFIQYWDDYERRDGRWYFKRRKLHRWYMVDALTRPSHGAGTDSGRETLRLGMLPDAWPSWARFWDERGRTPR